MPENVERLWAAIHKDWQLTVQELEDDPGIPKTVQDFDARFWHERFHGKICSMASATTAQGIS